MPLQLHIFALKMPLFTFVNLIEVTATLSAIHSCAAFWKVRA